MPKADESTTYTPLAWQVAPFYDTGRIMLLTGAAGGGKSRVAAEKFHAYMLRYPGVTGVVGRKDKTAAFKSVVPFLLYSVMAGTKWGSYHKGDGLFQYDNGSQAWVVGVRDESQRENLRSIGREGAFDIAWMEEANKLTLNDHQELSTRLRGTKGGYRQIIYSTNPDHPEHWIKKVLIDGKKANVYYSRPEDNPKNPPDYIEALQQLTGVFYQRMWQGLWVQAEGAIYGEYDSAKHCIDKRIATPVFGRYIITIDFGYTNPFSATLWRITSEGAMYQVRQIYKCETLVEDHAKAIKDMLFHYDLAVNNIEAWICDHDAEDRATLERHLGIKTLSAYKAIGVGIDAVKNRLSRNKLFLKYDAAWEKDEKLEKKYKPTCTAEEIVAYAWSDKKAETPIAEFDHGLDEMRYAVAYVDKIDRKILRVNTQALVTNYITGRITNRN